MTYCIIHNETVYQFDNQLALSICERLIVEHNATEQLSTEQTQDCANYCKSCYDYYCNHYECAYLDLHYLVDYVYEHIDQCLYQAFVTTINDWLANI